MEQTTCGSRGSESLDVPASSMKMSITISQIVNCEKSRESYSSSSSVMSPVPTGLQYATRSPKERDAMAKDVVMTDFPTEVEGAKIKCDLKFLLNMILG